MAGLLPRSLGFNIRSVKVTFVVENVVFEQGFIQIRRFSSFAIIPPMLHTHIYLHVTLTGRTNGRNLGT
jgi:hypothetical protein